MSGGDVFREYFESSLDLLAIAGEDGHFLELNPAWEAATGYTRSELLAQPFLEFVEPEDRAATERAFSLILAGEAILGFRNRYRRRDGGILWLEWYSARITSQGRIHAAARDVTGTVQEFSQNVQLRHELERLVEERTAELLAVQGQLVEELSAQIKQQERREAETELILELWRGDALQPGRLDAALRAVTRGAAVVLGLERVGVWRYNADRTALDCLLQYTASDDGFTSGETITVEECPNYFSALADRLVLAAVNAAEDPATCELRRSYLGPNRISSLLDVPLRAEAGIIGVLCHESVGTAREWSIQEQSFAAALADLASMALVVEHRRQTEEELRASEEQLELAMSGANMGLWDWKFGTEPVTYRGPALAILGYPDEHPFPEGIRWEHLIHPQDREQAVRALDSLVEGTVSTFELEHRVQSGDGDWRWVEARGRVVQRDASGCPLRAAGTFVDVTAERKTLAERRRLAAIVDASPELVATFDHQGRAIYVNVAGRALLGLSVDQELQLLELADLLPGGREGDTVLVAPDGRQIAVVATLVRHEDPDGDEWLTSLLARDVRSHKALEQQMLHAQKMDAIGRLAGVVAHDFNNLLAAISGFVEQLNSQSLPPEARHAVTEIGHVADRAASLTRQLLTVSRRRDLQLEPIHLGALVRDLAPMFRRLLGDTIDLTVQVGDGRDDLVLADRGQMEQVVLNLVVNARDAMPQGGVLTLALESNPGPPPWVILSVGDTGCGIPVELRERIFEPFFTTKPEGRGTGLGLSTVFGIVNQSGGSVVMQSSLGAGSSFRVRLPGAASDTSATPSLRSTPRSGPWTILVVDDSPDIRELMRLSLETAGHRVVKAGSYEAALNVLNNPDQPLDGVVTDENLSGRSGSDLIREIQAGARADLPVMLITGLSPLDLPYLGGVPVVRKPFRPQELVSQIQSLLGGSSGPDR